MTSIHGRSFGVPMSVGTISQSEAGYDRGGAVPVYEAHG